MKKTVVLLLLVAMVITFVPKLSFAAGQVNVEHNEPEIVSDNMHVERKQMVDTFESLVGFSDVQKTMNSKVKNVRHGQYELVKP